MLFRYGRVVTGKHFYDRSKMQKELRFLIDGGQSFMLKAPRRYGKTSLLKHILQSDKRDYFYIDFRKTPRLEVLSEKLIEYIYSKMGVEGALRQLRENVAKFMLENKTSLRVQVPFFEASVSLFSSTTASKEEKFIYALDMLEKLGQELQERLYVVFDEFQDAMKLDTQGDTLELMRGVMQHHENVCYMFAGSHTTLMSTIFESKKSPFYNFCRKYTLESFDTHELSLELITAFKTKGVVFASDELLIRLLTQLKGHPANTMLVMQYIELLMNDEEVKTITQRVVDEAYERAKEESSDLVNEYIRDIRSKEHLHDVIYRTANNQEQILDASSLQQKRAYLVDMGYLLKKGRGEYEIIDGFLEDELKSDI